jgi:hypothetical protein
MEPANAQWPIMEGPRRSQPEALGAARVNAPAAGTSMVERLRMWGRPCRAMASMVCDTHNLRSAALGVGHGLDLP